jgi:AcrR family transcriptional regulator
MARKYVMKQRAEQVERTRRRITEAAVTLHGTVGPARTTISAVAERAGVERLTVYRHFPDEDALFHACSSHWLSEHPFPDLEAWERIADPDERLRSALGDLYAWYRANEAMMANFLRDGPHVPALAGRLAEWEAYLDLGQRLLVRGLALCDGDGALLHAAVGHALRLETWASLARQGLDDAHAVELMHRLISSSRTSSPYGPSARGRGSRSAEPPAPPR